MERRSREGDEDDGGDGGWSYQERRGGPKRGLMYVEEEDMREVGVREEEGQVEEDDVL